MFDIHNYYSFLAAILIFQLIPGAGTIAILNATARHGVRVGMASVAGTLLGDFTYMVAAMAGLAAVLNSHPLLFQALQWFGAAYLIVMGIQLLHTPMPTVTDEPLPAQSAWTYFRQGFLVSLTNPKVMLFFVAFFPLFLQAQASQQTLIAMILHVSVISLVYQTALVFLGNAVAQRLKALPSARQLATRLAGIALIGFGLKLAFNNR